MPRGDRACQRGRAAGGAGWGEVSMWAPVAVTSSGVSGCPGGTGGGEG